MKSNTSLHILPCSWQLIYKQLKGIGLLEKLEEIVPPKD
jgi:hypothetical protein